LDALVIFVDVDVFSYMLQHPYLTLVRQIATSQALPSVTEIESYDLLQIASVVVFYFQFQFGRSLLTGSKLHLYHVIIKYLHLV